MQKRLRNVQKSVMHVRGCCFAIKPAVFLDVLVAVALLDLKVPRTKKGGVYMRKLALARVSYRNDFLISYRLYMMTGSFHIAFT